MSRLSDIPIRIELPAVTDSIVEDVGGGLGGGVHAILAELANLLDRLVDREEPGFIDLRSLPMSPQDRMELQRTLGEGEVRATLNAGGLSQLQETSVPGIWWVEHRDQHGELIAELIEVASVPAILARARDEIAAGASILRARIAAAAFTPTGEAGHGRRQ